MEIIVDGHKFSDSQSDIVVGFTKKEIEELSKDIKTKVVVYKSKSLNNFGNARVEEDIQEMNELMGLKDPD
jgi:hypothetical protein